ncbi:MAG: YneF family protein [Bacilli bacterium]
MFLMEFDGSWLGIAIACLVVGLAVGFFVTRKLIQKEMQKNPPISEKMIRAMFVSMGRKPSEAQIKQVMNSMKNSK